MYLVNILYNVILFTSREGTCNMGNCQHSKTNVNLCFALVEIGFLWGFALVDIGFLGVTISHATLSCVRSVMQIWLLLYCVFLLLKNQGCFVQCHCISMAIRSFSTEWHKKCNKYMIWHNID